MVKKNCCIFYLIGYSNAGLQSIQAEQRYMYVGTDISVWSYGIIGDLYNIKALLPLIPKLRPTLALKWLCHLLTSCPSPQAPIFRISIFHISAAVSCPS